MSISLYNSVGCLVTPVLLGFHWQIIGSIWNSSLMCICYSNVYGGGGWNSTIVQVFDSVQGHLVHAKHHMCLVGDRYPNSLQVRCSSTVPHFPFPVSWLGHLMMDFGSRNHSIDTMIQSLHMDEVSLFHGKGGNKMAMYIRNLLLGTVFGYFISKPCLCYSHRVIMESAFPFLWGLKEVNLH